ncbi:hypothetical protein ACI3PL_24375, partial [Lacticaseibacillus paracasei]
MEKTAWVRDGILNIAAEGNGRSFGSRRLRELGRPEETQDALDQLVADGMIVRTRNAQGAPVFHLSKPKVEIP